MQNHVFRSFVIASASAWFVFGGRLCFSQFEQLRVEGELSSYRDGELLSVVRHVEYVSGRDLFMRNVGNGWSDWKGSTITTPVCSESYSHTVEQEKFFLHVQWSPPQLLGRFERFSGLDGVDAFYPDNYQELLSPGSQARKPFDTPDFFLSILATDSVGTRRDESLARFLCPGAKWFDDFEFRRQTAIDSSLKDSTFSVNGSTVTISREAVESDDNPVGEEWRVKSVTRSFNGNALLRGKALSTYDVTSLTWSWSFEWQGADLAEIRYVDISKKNADVVSNYESVLKVALFESGDRGEVQKPQRTIVPPDGTPIAIEGERQISAQWRAGEIVRVYDSGVVERLGGASFDAQARWKWTHWAACILVLVAISFGGFKWVSKGGQRG